MAKPRAPNPTGPSAIKIAGSSSSSSSTYQRSLSRDKRPTYSVARETCHVPRRTFLGSAAVPTTLTHEKSMRRLYGPHVNYYAVEYRRRIARASHCDTDGNRV